MLPNFAVPMPGGRPSRYAAGQGRAEYQHGGPKTLGEPGNVPHRMSAFFRSICRFNALDLRGLARLSEIAFEESPPESGQQLHFDPDCPVQVFMDLSYPQ